VIRFSSIGDIVLTTPVVRSIKLDSSDNEVHFVTKKSFAELIDHNPNIDKVYSFEKSLSEIANELKLEKYDVVIDLHNNLRSRLITMFLNRPVSRFQKLNFKTTIPLQY
jgi:ADP-heptose:LPS heptosyltransferase